MDEHEPDLIVDALRDLREAIDRVSAAGLDPMVALGVLAHLREDAIHITGRLVEYNDLAGWNGRICAGPGCGRPLTGTKRQRYHDDNCRLRAFRAAKGRAT